MQTDVTQNPTPQQSSLRERIRAATREVHDRLDHSALAQKILSSDVQLSDYVQLLRKTYGFVKPLETLVHGPNSPVSDLDLNLEVREKSHLIEADLLALGLSVEGSNSIPLMLIEDDASISKAQAMGILYVLEGSTMGGMVLHRHLSEALGDKIAGATSFLNCYGPDTRRMFMDFVAVLDSFSADPAEQQVVCDAAFDTFLAIDRWMNG